MTVPTRLQFAEDLENLRRNLLQMGHVVDAMIAMAMQALVERNPPLAAEVIVQDDKVDDYNLLIEAECMRLLALQQPVARDLRTIGTALKIVTDLERIGGHAVDMAKVARKVAMGNLPDLLDALPGMAALVRQMLDEALNAFMNHDLVLADKVLSDRESVDTLFQEINLKLYNASDQAKEILMAKSHLLFVAHDLDHIAAHIVNIADRVFYIETADLSRLAKRLSSR